MITEQSSKGLVFGIPGLLLQIGCMTLSHTLASNAGAHIPAPPEWLALLSRVGSLIGVLLLIVGLRHYAKTKGYSDVFGLLGLLSLLGVFIMVALPDKTKV
jgi:hypothetical protein